MASIKYVEDDKGVMCRYDEENNDYIPVEKHCIDCGYKECECEEEINITITLHKIVDTMFDFPIWGKVGCVWKEKTMVVSRVDTRNLNIDDTVGLMLNVGVKDFTKPDLLIRYNVKTGKVVKVMSMNLTTKKLQDEPIYAVKYIHPRPKPVVVED